MRTVVVWLAAEVLFLVACGSKPERQSRLAGLEATFASGAVPAAGAEDDPRVYIKAAAEAVRQNDYAGSVLALQTVQRMPGMTAERLKAVHDAMQTLTDDLVARAARGDARAQADLAAIERSRSQ
jgi:hypothetical protein